MFATSFATPRARRVATILAVGALVPGLLGAGSWAARRLAVAPDSKLWIDGTSTVRSFTCRAGTLEGFVELDATPSDAAIDAARKSLRGSEIVVPVQALDCSNGTMNDHMRKALKADQFRDIRYRYQSHEAVPQADGSLDVTIQGSLTLAGTTLPMPLTGKAVEGAGGALQVKGSQQLDMTRFGIKPPSLMLGTMKVRPNVTVHFDMLVKP